MSGLVTVIREPAKYNGAVIPSQQEEKFVETRIVTVVGASGTLGAAIVRALLERGVRVRAMVRATSNRAKLESLGVTDYAVADLNDPSSLQRALTAEPRAEAVVASAAGFTVHSRRTKADNSKTDIEGYRHLVDAAKEAGISRFILISILVRQGSRGAPFPSKVYDREIPSRETSALSRTARRSLPRPYAGRCGR
jgi:nucleoside-diphosphate-sugar epimerase